MIDAPDIEMKKKLAKSNDFRSIQTEQSLERIKYSLFLNDLQEVRQKLHIPKLNQKTDYYPIAYEMEIVGDDSKWLTSQSKRLQQDFQEAIKNLIQKHHLTPFFDEWIREQLLYGKTKVSTCNTFELFGDIFRDPRKAEGIPLITSEKKFLKVYARYRLNVKGKPNKKVAKAYRYFLDNLKLGKNTERRKRVLNDTLAGLEIQSNPEQYNSTEEVDSTEKSKRKITSFEVALNQNEDIDDPEELKKIAARYRKNKQRLNIPQ